MNAGILELEEQQQREEIQANRLENERRFSPPRGACPWGCDGSGWEELADYVEPDSLEIYHGGGWLTPCQCNIGHAWFQDIEYPRRYPDDYTGPRILRPRVPTAEEIHGRFEEILKEGR